MKQPQIEITADGSATLYIPEIDEHYHSVKGALTESLHIFIQTGFYYSKADPLTIFEARLIQNIQMLYQALHASYLLKSWFAYHFHRYRATMSI